MRFALLHAGAFGLLLGTVAGCSHADDRLSLDQLDRPVGRGLALELHPSRTLGSGLDCQTKSLHGDDVAPQGGSIELCSYSRDQLTILDRRCDDDACTIEDGKTPESFVVRPTREGRVTVRVRAKAKSDGKELSGDTTITVVRVDHSDIVESENKALGLTMPLEKRRLAIDTTVHWHVRPIAADGAQLAGLVDVSTDGPARLDPCADSWCDEDIANVTVTGAGTAHLVAHAGDATNSFALNGIALDAKSHFELRPIVNGALGEPLTRITVDDLDSVISPVEAALVARAPDGSLSFVGGQGVVARPSEDARLLQIGQASGSPWVTIEPATTMVGTLALYAADQKLADVVVTSSIDAADAGAGADAR